MDIEAKLRPLYLLQILREQSDQNHKLTTAQLCKQLKDEYGIETFRTTIKTDIEVLQQAGYTIEVTRSSQNQYCYIEEDFSSREIKSILDTVLSSQLLATDLRDQIEAKLKRLWGPFKASELKRNWANRSCAVDDSPLEAVLDVINDAINKGRKIQFKEFTYNVKKEKVTINDNKPYTISPCFLTVKGNAIYVIGLSDDTASYCVHRVDHICEKPVILDSPIEPMRTGWAKRALDVPFGIETGVPTEIEIQVDNSMMGEIIDKFGPGVTTYACDQNSFRVIAQVDVGISFYQWVFGMQGKVRIRNPETTCLEYESMIRNAAG